MGFMASNLLSVLEHGARDKPALVVPEGPTLTYEQLRGAVDQAAEQLASFGVRRSDRVALVLPNGAESIVLFLAAAVAGTAAPLNPNYTEEEFRFYLEDTDARTLVVPRGGGEAARAALGDRGSIIEAFFDDSTLRLANGGPPPTSLRERGEEPPGGDDVALVLHTSGTTSRPKRVPLRHRNLLASVENIVRTYELSDGDVSLCIMPLFHVHGLVASTLSTFRSGGTVVVPSKFNPMGFWAVAREHRATWYSASPTPHQLLLMRAGDRRPEGAEHLRFIRSCSSVLTPEVQRRLEDVFGAPVLNAYGMTEASHQMASNPLPPRPRRPGTVGQGTGVEVGIMDEVGALLPAATEGEVVIRGPNVIDGYENNPEANAKSFSDGWFRTGDQGRLDTDGYLSLIGRIKELINRGGEKIPPAEVDEVLTRHPAVAEAVAFAAPHPTWGEEVAAAVVLRSPVDEKDLIRHCREHLADFKVPRKVYVVETIPRTATGKIQRRTVAEALISAKA
jgi:acyl-CoA synthetase (AMP-forming)/AMP-acid ligase II